MGPSFRGCNTAISTNSGGWVQEILLPERSNAPQQHQVQRTARKRQTVHGVGSVNHFQQHRVDFEFRRLAQELNTHVDTPWPPSSKDHTLEPDERSFYDAASTSSAQTRVKIDGFIACYDAVNVPQVRLESILIRHLEHVGDAVGLQGPKPILRVPTKKKIAGKEGNLDMHNTTPIGSSLLDERKEVLDL